MDAFLLGHGVLMYLQRKNVKHCKYKRKRVNWKGKYDIVMKLSKTSDGLNWIEIQLWQKVTLNKWINKLQKDKRKQRAIQKCILQSHVLTI